MIYLDNNAITQCFPEITEEVLRFISEYKYLNPSSVHEAGKKAKKILNEAKTSILTSLNAKCHDVYFVSGATEGNNMVLSSREFGKIFTIKTEHDSILSPLSRLKHEFIEVNEDGVVDLQDLTTKLKAFGSSNFLCSVSLANNETGLIQDINKIAEVVHEFGGVMHSDITQIIGKEKFDFNYFNADAITFSGNKIHSGFGGGVVIFTSGFEIKPLILGGGQQNFKRGGTENVVQIFSIAKAIQKINEDGFLATYKAQTLGFQQQIEEMVIKNGGEVFAQSQKRLTNTSMIKMKGVNNFIQMMEFDLAGICISTGSACSSGRTDVSHVLKACKLQESEAKNYIRVSTSILNTENEIKIFCKIWQELSKKV